MTPEEITDEIARVRSLTDKPFGVDLLHAINDNPVEEVKRIIDGGATSFAAGLGVPKRVIGMCHEAGLKVITVTATVKHARMAAEAGCDLIVAQGSEAGGHTGSVGAFALLPQAVDAVPIPVVAAGGILRRSRPGGGPCLRLRGRLDRHAVCRLARGPSGTGLQERDREGERKRHGCLPLLDGQDVASPAERNDGRLGAAPAGHQTLPESGGSDGSQGFARVSVSRNGRARPQHNCFPAGQGCGAIHEVQTCKQIVDEIVAQAETILSQGLVRSTRKP